MTENHCLIVNELTVKRRAGTGVHFEVFMKENTAGSCFSWAPIKNILAEVKRMPLTPPKVLRATNTGTSQLKA